jgi:hypothetical protein
VRQEVISYKEAHEDPIIQSPFEVKGEWLLRHIQLGSEILSEDGNMEPDEWFERGTFLLFIEFPILLLRLTPALLCLVTLLTTEMAGSCPRLLEEDVFTQYSEMRFMGSKTQHDQIGVLQDISSAVCIR